MQPSAGILAISGLPANVGLVYPNFSTSCTTPTRLKKWHRRFVYELYVDGGTRNREARTV